MCFVTSVCFCRELWVIQCICIAQHSDNCSGSPPFWEGLWLSSWCMTFVRLGGTSTHTHVNIILPILCRLKNVQIFQYIRSPSIISMIPHLQSTNPQMFHHLEVFLKNQWTYMLFSPKGDDTNVWKLYLLPWFFMNSYFELLYLSSRNLVYYIFHEDSALNKTKKILLSAFLCLMHYFLNRSAYEVW